MADITLEKPKAGEHVIVEAYAGARFVVEFDPNEATPSKDGSSFIFTFDDGSSITITNFYGTDSSELTPSLYLPHEILPYDDFFARIDEEILHSGDAHQNNEARAPAHILNNEHAMKQNIFDSDMEMDFKVEYGSDDVFFDTSYTFLHDEDTFAEAEDLFGADNTDLIAPRSQAQSDEDIVFMDFNGIFVDDSVYADVHTPSEDMDILLGTKNSLNSVKDMFAESHEGYMEMALLGDNLQGENVHDVLECAGITKNIDGSISLSQGWHAEKSTPSFTEYTHNENEATLIVHQTLIVNGV